MNKYLLLILLPGLLVSCKSKKVSLAENNADVDVHDFIEFFQPLKLPYKVTDTLLSRRERDTITINPTLFSRFVPDSVLAKYFGKQHRLRLYAIGKVKVPDNETYLLVKVTGASRKALMIVCFDKKSQFMAARPMLYTQDDSGIKGQAGIDTKYTITVYYQRKDRGGRELYTRDAYVYNGAGSFQLILTESNEGSTKPPPIYNPIDTLSRKHKYTGDYSQDKRNFITVRDTKDPSRILFFVHFEKDEGQCKGELKGEARFVSPTVARFRGHGDPCTIDFTFSATGVRMKELEGCGNHRDIKCFFEGYYTRHKEPKPAKNKHR